MASLKDAAERQAFSLAIDATLKSLNKDREKGLLNIVNLAQKFMGSNFRSEAYEGAKKMIQNPDSKWMRYALNLIHRSLFQSYKCPYRNRVILVAGCLSAPGRTVDCGFPSFPVEVHDGVIVVQQFTTEDMLQPQSAVRTLSRSAFALEEISLSIFLYDGSVH